MTYPVRGGYRVVAFPMDDAPRTEWLDRLPGLQADLFAEWELVPDGPPQVGHRSLVVPVRTSAAQAAMLKIGFPTESSRLEHLALRRWDGVGAVRLLRADPHRRANLLERLTPDGLTTVDDVDACEIVGALYGQLHRPSPPQLLPLTAYLENKRSALMALPRNAPIPRRLVEQTLGLVRDLIADPDTVGTLIHTDLHYENVLASSGSAWLAIAPKPLNGDPHFEPAPMLWNRFGELSGGVRRGVRRRFHTLVDTSGLDEDRARSWVIVRTVLTAVDGLGAADTKSTHDWITSCVAIAKAVQD